jgi:hypothetical protein
MMESREISLGGKWWMHTGDCSEVQIGPHVHYGQNVILGADPNLVPAHVLAKYAAYIEVTDAPPYQTTARIPTVIRAAYPGSDPT